MTEATNTKGYPLPPEDYYQEPTEINASASQFIRQCAFFVMRYLEEIPHRQGQEQVSFADYAIAEDRLTDEVEQTYSEDPLGDTFALGVAIDLTHQRLDTISNDELQEVDQKALEAICFDLCDELRALSSEQSEERKTLVQKINKGLSAHGLSITEDL